TGKGAQLGVLIKGGEALQRARNVSIVVLDKTGTITEGKPTVTEILTSEGESATSVLSLAAGVEGLSEHPIADAIVHAARERAVTRAAVRDFESRPGRGTIARTSDGRRIAIGSAVLMRALGL